MLSGRRLDLLDPHPWILRLRTLPTGLPGWHALMARLQATGHSASLSIAYWWNGFSRFYPDMSRQWRLACLLHDAAEFVIGDMITPFKTILADEYKAVESRLTVAVHIRSGLPGCCPIMSTRRSSAPMGRRLSRSTQLAGFSEAEARKAIARPRDVPPIKIKPQQPQDAANICGASKISGGKGQRQHVQVDVMLDHSLFAFVPPEDFRGCHRRVAFASLAVFSSNIAGSTEIVLSKANAT